MPNGVPMSWLRTSLRPSRRCSSTRERRRGSATSTATRVLGLQRRGHVDVRRIRTGPVVEAVSRRRRRGGHAVPPAERGRAVGRRGARPPIRVAEVAVHAQRHAREHRGDPRRACAHRSATRSCSSTGSTTATSTRRSSTCRTGSWCRKRAACRATSRRRRRWCSSTTPRRVRAALEPRDVAVVITEPTMTNNVRLLLPEPGFHDALRAITRETGTVSGIDETHTHVVGSRADSPGCGRLQPDVGDDREVHRRRRSARRATA